MSSTSRVIMSFQTPGDWLDPDTCTPDSMQKGHRSPSGHQMSLSLVQAGQVWG